MQRVFDPKSQLQRHRLRRDEVELEFLVQWEGNCHRDNNHSCVGRMGGGMVWRFEFGVGVGMHGLCGAMVCLWGWAALPAALHGDTHACTYAR
eukprot:363010-Chlamydomonas_euryale.AAC.3